MALRECDNDVSRAAENLLSFSICLTNIPIILLLISRLLFRLLNLFSLHSSELSSKDNEEAINQNKKQKIILREATTNHTEKNISLVLCELLIIISRTVGSLLYVTEKSKRNLKSSLVIFTNRANILEDGS